MWWEYSYNDRSIVSLLAFFPISTLSFHIRMCASLCAVTFYAPSLSCVCAYGYPGTTFLCVKAFRIYINYILNDVHHCSFVQFRNVLHCQQYTKNIPRRGPLWVIIIMHVLGSPFQPNWRPHTASRRDLSCSQLTAAFLALTFFFFALVWFDCIRCTTTLNPLNNGADYIGSIQILDYREML